MYNIFWDTVIVFGPAPLDLCIQVIEGADLVNLNELRILPEEAGY